MINTVTYYRELRDLTVEQLAEKIGRSGYWIEEIEKGRQAPEHTQKLLAVALDTPIEILFPESLQVKVHHTEPAQPEISGIRILGPDEKLVIQFKGDLDGAQFKAAADHVNDLLSSRENRALIVDGTAQIFVIREKDPSTQKIQIKDGGK